MIPWIEYHIIYLGPIPIQVWGLFVALGILISALIVRRLATLNKINVIKVTDGLLATIVGGLLGARFFHVLFYEPLYYLSNPLDIIKIWEGGMSSFGGLLGAVLSFLWFYRKDWKESKIYLIAELYSFAAIFGWIIGRVGCFLIHDHPGKICDGGLLCVNFPGTPRYDMALLEILGLIPLIIIFLLAYKKIFKIPSYSGLLFLYYGILRLFLDFWRSSDQLLSDSRYFGLTPGQYFAIITAVLGLYLLKKGQINHGRFA